MPAYFCSFCGSEILDPSWPRRCPSCRREHFRNPLPVAVVLIPVDQGVLAVRRAINPGLGKLALPGGFIDFGESWQQAGAREVWEETGLVVQPCDLHLVDVASVAEGFMLVFCSAPPVQADSIAAFVPNPEVSALAILREPTELAFSTHTEQLTKFLRR